jgi:predicted TIM-barrel fold metal-dependent hydrolase
MEPNRLINEIKSINLAPETERQILGENARQLLGLV